MRTIYATLFKYVFHLAIRENREVFEQLKTDVIWNMVLYTC